MASEPMWINAGQGDSVGTATIAAATDLATITAHGLNDGDAIMVDTLTGGAVGVLETGVVYYVRDATADAFAIVSAPGDEPVDFTADGGADVFTAVPRYAADELRRAQGMFLYSDTATRFGARSGVHPSNDPAVTLASTTWTVEDIRAVVHPGLTSQAGPYVVQHPEESGALDPADGTNPRIDALDLQVQDDDEDSSGFRRTRVVYAVGTPAATPAAPTVTVSSLRLATILVPATGTPSPTVQTLAQFTVTAGGVLPVPTAAELPTLGVYKGMAVFQQDTDALLVHDGAGFVAAGNTQGFQFGGREIYTSSGTFDKGDFPGLRAVDVQVQGGGGGGGGAQATGAGEASCGAGGEGGGYARSFILASSLAASETVTVGAGGSGATGAAGLDGGTSSFINSGGSNVSASGGSGGSSTGAANTAFVVSGGESTQVLVGDIQIPGGGGGAGLRHGGGPGGTIGGHGGSSVLGTGARAVGTGVTRDFGNGFGGGASGVANSASATADPGGLGAPGVVIVTLYF